MITITLPRNFAGQRAVIVFVASQRRLLRVLPGRKVRVSFRGVRTVRGRPVAVAIWGRRSVTTGRRPNVTRLYALCTDRGVGQINVPPRR